MPSDDDRSVGLVLGIYGLAGGIATGTGTALLWLLLVDAGHIPIEWVQLVAAAITVLAGGMAIYIRLKPRQFLEVVREVDADGE